MSGRYRRGMLHLAAAVDLPDRPGAGPCAELVRLAEHGRLDFVTLGDSTGRPGAEALDLLAAVASATRRIGLVGVLPGAVAPWAAPAAPEPTASAALEPAAWAVPEPATPEPVGSAASGPAGRPAPEPAAWAVLDRIAGGRAGRWIEAPGTEAAARAAGRTGPEAAGPAGAARGPWDAAGGAAEGAPDVPEAGVGVRGATASSASAPARDHPHPTLLAPAPPRTHPVRVADAGTRPARAFAARFADVALVRAATPAQAVAVREDLRSRATRSGRDPGALRILVSLRVDLGGGERAAEPGHGGGGPRPTAQGPLYRGGPVDLADLLAAWHTEGAADGFHLVPVEPRRDLERLVNGTVALLQHRGLFRTFYPGGTLREHLGLARPVHHSPRPKKIKHIKGWNSMAIDASDAWKQWREKREESVTAPYGPLALTATHWIEDQPEGRLPDIPGTWVADGEGVVLTAVETDGLQVDRRPFGGEIRLTADTGPEAAARVSLGEKRLVVLVREGVWGVRVYDPGAEARRAFRGIEATAYDPGWAVPGRFTPYDARRVVRLGNADGRARGFALAGELAFTVGGRERTLAVARQGEGPLWVVFADATSGDTSFRFRFLFPDAPDAQGRTTVDFNRAQLPPCAFADHFLCPFPPPGNTLDIAVEAGERTLR
ncbi:hypothetical protein Shyhy01_65500 [Streptomyces hygroscopicus subsp. hygroscopicus]|nr:hypothetical protein Shyhy01_65500 [Streptomyces hygroscopicus subsp. hygroscopicus]